MKLRDYQQKAVADIRDAFKRNRRVLFTLPCGGGKTVLFSYMAYGVQKNGKRVVIQAHRKELLKQVSRALDQWGVNHAVLTSESRGTPRAPVIVASSFTLVKRLKGMIEPHLIVTDEAHHAPGNGNTWSKILDEFPNAYSLGVTATPARTSGEGLRGCFDELVVGPSVAELTAMGYLAPVEVYASKDALDLRGLRVRGGDYISAELESAMDKPRITGSAVREYLRICPGKRAVAFCVSVKHAADVAAEFRAAGVPAESVDGGLDDWDREARLMRFERGDTRVLASADLISEGYDVPGIEVVIGLRPTKSLILYTQQLGRGLRPFPGKDRCIYLDHGGATQQFGFIDEPRSWSLDGIKDVQNRERASPVSVCPECYAMHSPAIRCPKCGYVYGQSDGRIVKQVDGELERISRPEDVANALEESDVQKRYAILVNVARYRQIENPERWAREIIFGEAARKYAKEGRKAESVMVAGLTLEERDRLMRMIRGTTNQVEMVL